MLDFTWSKLEDMTALAFHEIVVAREAVFIVEQTCPYQGDGRAGPACLAPDWSD